VLPTHTSRPGARPVQIKRLPHATDPQTSNSPPQVMRPLAEPTQITVHDSTAGMGYMVLQTRLDNTSNMMEYELAELVARDCMIGV